jgi:hypothetical protein
VDPQVSGGEKNIALAGTETEQSRTQPVAMLSYADSGLKPVMRKSVASAGDRISISLLTTP